MNTEEKFIKKLKQKYPHAYSLVPDFMWGWIFRNLILKQLK